MCTPSAWMAIFVTLEQSTGQEKQKPKAKINNKNGQKLTARYDDSTKKLRRGSYELGRGRRFLAVGNRDRVFIRLELLDHATQGLCACDPHPNDSHEDGRQIRRRCRKRSQRHDKNLGRRTTREMRENARDGQGVCRAKFPPYDHEECRGRFAVCRSNGYDIVDHIKGKVDVDWIFGLQLTARRGGGLLRGYLFLKVPAPSGGGVLNRCQDEQSRMKPFCGLVEPNSPYQSRLQDLFPGKFHPMPRQQGARLVSAY